MYGPFFRVTRRTHFWLLDPGDAGTVISLYQLTWHDMICCSSVWENRSISCDFVRMVSFGVTICKNIVCFQWWIYHNTWPFCIIYGVGCKLPLIYIVYILGPMNVTRMQEWLYSYSRVMWLEKYSNIWKFWLKNECVSILLNFCDVRRVKSTVT